MRGRRPSVVKPRAILGWSPQHHHRGLSHSSFFLSLIFSSSSTFELKIKWYKWPADSRNLNHNCTNIALHIQFCNWSLPGEAGWLILLPTVWFHLRTCFPRINSQQPTVTEGLNTKSTLLHYKNCCDCAFARLHSLPCIHLSGFSDSEKKWRINRASQNDCTVSWSTIAGSTTTTNNVTILHSWMVHLVDLQNSGWTSAETVNGKKALQC